MRYFSMFSGIGGFELGIKQASELLPIIPTCVGYSEIDKYAIQVYQSHFDHKNYGNATTINAAELPDFDLLVGGFPCQSFSVAGKRRGFEDTRGTLFFDIARILRAKQPTNFVLENVKGLLSHNNGQTFKTIIATLTELGYDVEWQVLNSKNFGVPQNRERVYIVGYLRGKSKPKVFPLRTYSQADIVLPTLTARYYGAQANGGYIRNKPSQVNESTHSNNRVYAKDGINPTLNTMQGGNRQSKILEGAQVRRLTPVECERLQGFPDQWTNNVSDTQRYKTLGNAVTVNVVQRVVHDLFFTPNSNVV